MDILSLLQNQNRIEPSAIAEVIRDAGGAGAPQEKIETALGKHGIGQEDLLKAESDFYQMPARLVGDLHPSFEILRYIPEESARYYGIVPLEVEDGTLSVGVVDPDNLEARDALNFIASKAGLPYKLFIVTYGDFRRLLDQYKGFEGEVGTALTELETEPNKPSGTAAEAKRNADLEAKEVEKEDAPITKIVTNIVKQAAEQGASDIHIEPLADHTRVRFRVDGVLQTNLKLPPNVHVSVVSRVKVLSNMRLDEKRKPQDGRFTARVDGEKIDFRVSTFPTYYGEKVVMRLLGMQASNWRLGTLGFSPRNLALIKAAIRKPYGLILISGPTGSGKSTTLYALLNEIDTEHRNVLSLEDPVEYTIPGVNQSQVHPEIGYTFANGLRTTLRQDPNVIMVGEIRDKETADLAVQAALTGHLVLSTIHTNNAIGIVPRLRDMDVDPYLIPPTLILGMAQRLIKTLCPGSGEKVPVEGSLKEMIDAEFADVPANFRSEIPQIKELYRIKGTPDCPGGTKGRTMVAEAFNMTPALENSILAGKPEDDLFKLVREDGMLTMKEDAIIKCAEGRVPLEEVNTLGGEFEVPENDVTPTAKTE
ncbi:MAG: GspE/PulE family protein [Minisyncoccia bacterium]